MNGERYPDATTAGAIVQRLNEENIQLRAALAVEREAVSDARWDRLERGMMRLEANHELILDHLRILTERYTVLENQHARNHPVALSVPPSNRGPDLVSSIEPEAQEA